MNGDRLVGSTCPPGDHGQAAFGPLQGRGLQKASPAYAERSLDDNTAAGALRGGIQMAVQRGQYVFTPYQWIHDCPRVALENRPTRAMGMAMDAQRVLA
ncbi:hypothetical protein GCM10009780_52570 [Actinomadura alba]